MSTSLRKAYHQVPERPAYPPYFVNGRMDFPRLRKLRCKLSQAIPNALLVTP
jgi:hypothetical protein